MVRSEADYLTRPTKGTENSISVTYDNNHQEQSIMACCPTLSDSRPPNVLICVAVLGVSFVTALLFPAALTGAQTPDAKRVLDEPAGAAMAETQPTSEPASHHLREGTELVDQPGYFKITGDRVTFFSAHNNADFVGLENLNLERIARAIANNPAQLKWQVTGTITEYRGANFLLVKRAILTPEGTSSDNLILEFSAPIIRAATGLAPPES